jgi:hypothetical protein
MELARFSGSRESGSIPDPATILQVGVNALSLTCRTGVLHNLEELSAPP